MDTSNDPRLPLYWQIAEQLRHQIAEQRYREGAQLPTEEELSRMFGVSRITVRAALDRLAAEGLLRRERGRGTFITAPTVEHDLGQLTDFAEDMATVGMRPSSQVTHFGEELSTGPVAKQLGLTPGAVVTRVDRLRLADGQPLAFDRTYLPPRYGRLLDRAALATETVLRQLEAHYDVPIVGGRYTIEATAASGELSQVLDVAADAPLLLLHRTSSTTGGEIVYYQQRHYRGDRVRYTLDLHRPGPQGRARLVAFAPEYASP